MSVSGALNYDDAPIGDPGTTNQKNTIWFVVADTDCQLALNAIRPDASGDTVAYGLPRTCRVMQGVVVYVTNP